MDLAKVLALKKGLIKVCKFKDNMYGKMKENENKNNKNNNNNNNEKKEMKNIEFIRQYYGHSLFDNQWHWQLIYHILTIDGQLTLTQNIKKQNQKKSVFLQNNINHTKQNNTHEIQKNNNQINIKNQNKNKNKNEITNNVHVAAAV